MLPALNKTRPSPDGDDASLLEPSLASPCRQLSVLVPIAAAGGGTLRIADDDCVAAVLSWFWCERVPQWTPWGGGGELSRRAWRRMFNRAKRWLNTQAVEQMTPELLAECDPDDELLRSIAQIASGFLNDAWTARWSAALRV